MGDIDAAGPNRSPASTTTWDTACKDCLGEARAATASADVLTGSRRAVNDLDDKSGFTYSDDWVARTLERGGTRSDRCPRHRRTHRQAIEANAVAYIDIKTIGEVADRENPTGPLGGLGPLPVRHRKTKTAVELETLTLGMGDDDIIELMTGLTKKRVAVLEAGTGTGKSTFMPFRLMQPPPGAPLSVTDAGPIVVTEPRVPATTRVASFVGERLCFGHDPRCGKHVGPGFPVGYQVSGEKQWDDACRLIYVTDGTMINWIRDGRLARIGTVIVDEAHERSENIDLILALLRDELPRYPHLRVIIASATINRAFFVEFFGGEKSVHPQRVPAVKTIGYGIPLFPREKIGPDEIAQGTDDGTGTDERFAGWPSRGPVDARGVTEDLHETTEQLLALRADKEIPPDDWIDKPDDWIDKVAGAVAAQILRICGGTPSGDILAFLPTSSLIDDVVEAVKTGLKTIKRDRRSAEVVSFRRDSSPADKEKAQRPSGPRRKIVIATNLAETSLTISGIRYVVDSGLICETEWDPSTCREDYPIKGHSRSGVRQRWGRVGREAPGWVFPLYTKQQFAQLPRDTAPGSTRANLEVFVAKLKSAGIDNVSSLPLPGNFSHENIERDQAGEEAAAVFTAELQRTESALRLNGAVDSDGHLTQLGRELERFRGSPEVAMALMYADQLACVPEVATAMALLGDGPLVGSSDRSVFRYDSKDWPPEWRVHAAECHRALALGCVDDLEVVIRAFASWEEASDSEKWAAQWWINSACFFKAKQEAASMIADLSPAMKQTAVRPLELGLVARARVAISCALASQRYAQGEAGWVSAADADGEPMQTARECLTEPPPLVVALSRFRPRARRGQQTPSSPIIQGLVAVPKWATEAGTPTPFSIVCEAARRYRAEDAVPSISEVTAPLRRNWPVGSLVQAQLDDTGAPVSLKIVVSGFAFPAEELGANRANEPSDRSSRWSDGDEVSGDWGGGDPGRVQISEVPPEELESRILSVSEQETPEDPAAWADTQDLDPAERVAAIGSEGPVAAVASPATLLPRGQSFSAVIEGHATDAGRPAIVLRACAADVAASVDPAEHAGLGHGDRAEVEVGRTRKAYSDEFQILHRTDGPGELLLDERENGLDAYLPAMGARLEPASRWALRIVPGSGRHERIRVALLPALKEDLDRIPVAEIGANSHTPSWRQGVIVGRHTQADGTEHAVIEVVGADPPLARHRFLSPVEELKGSGIEVVVGSRLEVRIGAARVRWRRKLDAQVEGLDRIVETHSQFLGYEEGGETVAAKPGGVSLHVVHELAALDTSATWQRDVWQLWLDGFHHRIVKMQPLQARFTLPLSTHHAVTLAPSIRRDIGQRTGARIYVKDGELHVEGLDAHARSAREEIVAAASRPTLVIQLPADRKVVGKSRQNLSKLEATPGVIGLDLRGNVLTIAAANVEVLASALQTIRATAEQATGELVLPSSANPNALIGKQGSTIKSLQSDSGCRAEMHRERGVVTIDGPSQAALKRFAALAAAHVPGVELRVTRAHTIKVQVIDGTELGRLEDS